MECLFKHSNILPLNSVSGVTVIDAYAAVQTG